MDSILLSNYMQTEVRIAERENNVKRGSLDAKLGWELTSWQARPEYCQVRLGVSHKSYFLEVALDTHNSVFVPDFAFPGNMNYSG